ncbi:MAG TPA: hypothetical protein VIT22_03160 [Pseudoxanthomonas sp.]
MVLLAPMKAGQAFPLLLLLAVASADACVTPPADQHAPVDVLITSAESIVLAKATGATQSGDYRSVYTLEPIRQIAGASAARFEIVGYSNRDGRKGRSDWTFNNHVDKVFWEDDWAGRVVNSTDCKLYPPFQVGGVYLVFFGATPHVKGFERILDQTNDKWLHYVEAKAGR